MKIKIVGEVDEGCDYLTSGKVYDVIHKEENLVRVIDDTGWRVSVLTEHSEWDCAHLGPNAKAVFVD